MTEPTELDHRNAECHRQIADRQREAYNEVLRWALGAFGPGWLPTHPHFLLTKEEEERARATGDKPIAAKTVYTVKNAAGRKRHFTVQDGIVKEWASYEEGLGPMLLEPHPTRTIEVRGQLVHPHHYSLCFAPYELYAPKDAETLAKLRESREHEKAEREERKWSAENPLLKWAGVRKEDLETDGRGC
jgi:hypothetical protein